MPGNVTELEGRLDMQDGRALVSCSLSGTPVALFHAAEQLGWQRG